MFPSSFAPAPMYIRLAKPLAVCASDATDGVARMPATASISEIGGQGGGAVAVASYMGASPEKLTTVAAPGACCGGLGVGAGKAEMESRAIPSQTSKGRRWHWIKGKAEMEPPYSPEAGREGFDANAIFEASNCADPSLPVSKGRLLSS